MMKIVVKIVPYSINVHTDTPKFYTIHYKPVIPNQNAVACNQLLDFLEFLVKLINIYRLGCLNSFNSVRVSLIF